MSGNSSRPVAASQTFAVRSMLPVAKRLPSWLNATAPIWLLWPATVKISVPVSADHMLTAVLPTPRNASTVGTERESSWALRLIGSGAFGQHLDRHVVPAEIPFSNGAPQADRPEPVAA